MSKPLYIYGAGGLGREVAAMVCALPEWHVGGFFDDNPKALAVKKPTDYAGGLNDLIAWNEPINVVLAFGNPIVKARMEKNLSPHNHITFPTLIDPRALLLDEKHIEIGSGCVLGAGCVLTTQIKIGRHVLINLNVTVGHNTEIGDFCSVMPGANLAGEVTLKQSVLVGSGANVLNKLTVHERTVVGAGAVVTKSLGPGLTVVGAPAKKLVKS